MSPIPLWMCCRCDALVVGGGKYDKTCPYCGDQRVEEGELSAKDEIEHGEFVRRVASEYGFPLSDWVPVRTKGAAA